MSKAVSERVLHVAERASEGAGVFFCLFVLKELLADSKVAQFGKPEVGLDENVIRFQVPVDLLALVMHEPERLQQL